MQPRSNGGTRSWAALLASAQPETGHGRSSIDAGHQDPNNNDPAAGRPAAGVLPLVTHSREGPMHPVPSEILPGTIAASSALPAPFMPALMAQARRSAVDSRTGKLHCRACHRAFPSVMQLAQHLADKHGGINSDDAKFQELRRQRQQQQNPQATSAPTPLSLLPGPPVAVQVTPSQLQEVQQSIHESLESAQRGSLGPNFVQSAASGNIPPDAVAWPSLQNLPLHQQQEQEELKDRHRLRRQQQQQQQQQETARALTATMAPLSTKATLATLRRPAAVRPTLKISSKALSGALDLSQGVAVRTGVSRTRTKGTAIPLAAFVAASGRLGLRTSATPSAAAGSGPSSSTVAARQPGTVERRGLKRENATRKKAVSHLKRTILRTRADKAVTIAQAAFYSSMQAYSTVRQQYNILQAHSDNHNARGPPRLPPPPACVGKVKPSVSCVPAEQGLVAPSVLVSQAEPPASEVLTALQLLQSPAVPQVDPASLVCHQTLPSPDAPDLPPPTQPLSSCTAPSPSMPMSHMHLLTPGVLQLALEQVQAKLFAKHSELCSRRSEYAARLQERAILYKVPVSEEDMPEDVSCLLLDVPGALPPPDEATAAPGEGVAAPGEGVAVRALENTESVLDMKGVELLDTAVGSTPPEKEPQHDVPATAATAAQATAAKPVDLSPSHAERNVDARVTVKAADSQAVQATRSGGVQSPFAHGMFALPLGHSDEEAKPCPSTLTKAQPSHNMSSDGVRQSGLSSPAAVCSSHDGRHSIADEDTGLHRWTDVLTAWTYKASSHIGTSLTSSSIWRSSAPHRFIPVPVLDRPIPTTAMSGRLPAALSATSSGGFLRSATSELSALSLIVAAPSAPATLQVRQAGRQAAAATAAALLPGSAVPAQPAVAGLGQSSSQAAAGKGTLMVQHDGGSNNRASSSVIKSESVSAAAAAAAAADGDIAAAAAGDARDAGDAVCSAGPPRSHKGHQCHQVALQAESTAAIAAGGLLAQAGTTAAVQDLGASGTTQVDRRASRASGASPTPYSLTMQRLSSSDDTASSSDDADSQPNVLAGWMQAAGLTARPFKVAGQMPKATAPTIGAGAPFRPAPQYCSQTTAKLQPPAPTTTRAAAAGVPDISSSSGTAQPSGVPQAAPAPAAPSIRILRAALPTTARSMPPAAATPTQQAQPSGKADEPHRGLPTGCRAINPGAPQRAALQLGCQAGAAAPQRPSAVGVSSHHRASKGDVHSGAADDQAALAKGLMPAPAAGLPGVERWSAVLLAPGQMGASAASAPGPAALVLPAAQAAAAAAHSSGLQREGVAVAPAPNCVGPGTSPSAWGIPGHRQGSGATAGPSMALLQRPALQPPNAPWHPPPLATDGPTSSPVYPAVSLPGVRSGTAHPAVASAPGPPGISLLAHTPAGAAFPCTVGGSTAPPVAPPGAVHPASGAVPSSTLAAASPDSVPPAVSRKRNRRRSSQASDVGLQGSEEAGLLGHARGSKGGVEVAAMYRCVTCNLACSGSVSWEQHLASRKHLQRAARELLAATNADGAPDDNAIAAAANSVAAAATGAAPICTLGGSTSPITAGETGGNGGGPAPPVGMSYHPLCHQVVLPELNALASEVLLRVKGFQERAFLKNPIKAAMHKWYVCGLREVAKATRLRKARAVVLAPNIEQTDGEGGLDDHLTTILERCAELELPVVFALSRKKMGELYGFKRRVSAVALLETNAVTELLSSMVALAAEGRSLWVQQNQSMMATAATASAAMPPMVLTSHAPAAASVPTTATQPSSGGRADIEASSCITSGVSTTLATQPHVRHEAAPADTAADVSQTTPLAPITMITVDESEVAAERHPRHIVHDAGQLCSELGGDTAGAGVAGVGAGGVGSRPLRSGLTGRGAASAATAGMAGMAGVDAQLHWAGASPQQGLGRASCTFAMHGSGTVHLGRWEAGETVDSPARGALNVLAKAWLPPGTG